MARHSISTQMKKLGLLTVAEAADYLNVPRPTLYQHLREGRIPGIQIGGRWRIEQDQLNDFIVRAKRGGRGDEYDSQSHANWQEATLAPNVIQSRMGLPNTTDYETLRNENARLRTVVTDQLLEIQELRARSKSM